MNLKEDFHPLGERLLSDLVDQMGLVGQAVVRSDPKTFTAGVVMAEQVLMDGVADDLMRAAQGFVDKKNAIQALKVELDAEKDKILAEMRKQDRETLTITVGAENYFFEIKRGEDDLRCVKQTKSPAPASEGDIG